MSFTITGTKPAAPIVSVDKNNVLSEEYYKFTIDTSDADVLMYKYSNTYEGWSSLGAISIQGDITEWSEYNNGTQVIEYIFAVLKDGKWSAWSNPITINVRNRPNLAKPEVQADESIISGKDYTFSFAPVENATSYGVYFESAYGDKTLYSWGTDSALPDTDLKVPGYLINSGSYVLYVSVYADGFATSSKSIYITASGKRPNAPTVMVEEPLRIKRKAEFSIDTEGAEALRVKYRYTAANRWWSEEQADVPVTEATTIWEHTINNGARKLDQAL